MLNALWSAASGMKAQQLQVDVIANNLSNVNTVGYKKSRASFQDLMYQTLRSADGIDGQPVPAPLQVGRGVAVAATYRDMSPGGLEQTGRELDFAIQGRGFFRVKRYDGTEAYTRAGNFAIGMDGNTPYLTDTNGNRILDKNGNPIRLPDQFTSLKIGPDGTIVAEVPAQPQLQQVGRLAVVYFKNPAGLENLGDNLYKATAASGQAMEVDMTVPGEAALVGSIRQGYLESSNVQVVEEMVNLITAQRAYELGSKAIQTSDEMLGLANNLRR